MERTARGRGGWAWHAQTRYRLHGLTCPQCRPTVLGVRSRDALCPRGKTLCTVAARAEIAEREAGRRR